MVRVCSDRRAAARRPAGAIAAAVLCSITAVHAGIQSDPDGSGGPGGGGPGSDTPSGGWRLFSVDRTTGDLVTIDPGTGAISVVGSLGTAVHDADLAWHNGRLYALLRDVTGPARLLELNPGSGAVISSVHVAWNGSPVTVAEGLTSDGNALRIGFSSGANTAFSNALGTLGTDGLVTSVADLSPLNPLIDLDGLGWNPATGALVGVDTIMAPVDRVDFFSIGNDPQAIGFMASLDRSAPIGAINDIEFIGSSLYAIDHLSGRLHVLAGDGGLTDSLLLGTGSYFGLAWGYMVPSPGAMALLALAGITGRARRRRGSAGSS